MLPHVPLLLLAAAFSSDAFVVRHAPFTTLDNRAASLRSAEVASLSAASVASPKAGSDSHKEMLVNGLAFMSGVTDVACFGRFGSFCNMMTGNTFQLSVALASLKVVDVLYYSTVLLCFVSGVGAYRVVDVQRRRRLTPSAIAPAVLALFCVGDVLQGHVRCARCALFPLALACGIVNAASSEVTGTITTMVTGHMQRLSNALVDWLSPGELGAATRDAAGRSLCVLVTFILGTVAGVRLFGGLGAPLPRYCFSALGLIYATMLVLHDRPDLGASVRVPRPPLQRQAAEPAAAVPCEDDEYGAECETEQAEMDEQGQGGAAARL